MSMPRKKPVAPPRKENQPTIDGFMPMALSIPCTGKGVKTSQFLKPASRTISAARMASPGVSNWAMRPYGLVEVMRSSVMMSFRAAQRMMRVGLRGDRFDFGDGDQGN